MPISDRWRKTIERFAPDSPYAHAPVADASAPLAVEIQNAADRLNSWLDSGEGKVALEMLRVTSGNIILHSDNEPVAGFLPTYLLTKDGLVGADLPQGEWLAYKGPNTVTTESDYTVVGSLEVVTAMVNDSGWDPSSIVPAIRRTLEHACRSSSNEPWGRLILQR